MQNNVVKVLLHDEEVGRLYWDVKQRRAIFSFAPSFVSRGLDIAPLIASVKSAGVTAYTIMGNREKLFQGLPPFIADSLPDRWAIRCLSSGHASIRLDFYCKFRRRIL